MSFLPSSLFVVFTGAGLSMLLSHGASFYAGHTLGSDEFAIIYFIINNANIISSILQLSIGYALIKFSSQYRVNDSQRCSNYIYSCLDLSNRIAAVGFVSLVLICLFFYSVNIEFLAKVSLFAQIVIVVNAIILSIFYVRLSISAAFEDFKVNSAILILVNIPSFISILGFSLVHSFEIFYLVFTAGNMLNLLFINRVNAMRYLNTLPRCNDDRRRLIRGIVSFAFPAAISGFVSMGVLWGVNVYIMMQPEGVRLYGLLAVFIVLKSLFLSLPQLANRVLLPYFSRLLGFATDEAINRAIMVGFVVNLIIAIPFSVAIYFYGDAVVGIAYGSKYEEISKYVKYLSVIVVADMLFQSLYQVIQMHAKMWWSLWYLVVPREVVFIATLLVSYGDSIVSNVVSGYVISSLVALICVFALIRLRFPNIKLKLF